MQTACSTPLEGLSCSAGRLHRIGRVGTGRVLNSCAWCRPANQEVQTRCSVLFVSCCRFKSDSSMCSVLPFKDAVNSSSAAQREAAALYAALVTSLNAMAGQHGCAQMMQLLTRQALCPYFGWYIPAGHVLQGESPDLGCTSSRPFVSLAACMPLYTLPFFQILPCSSFDTSSH